MMKKRGLAVSLWTAKVILSLAVLIGSLLPAGAFTGSDLSGEGVKFYLFNIYQAKFLGADCKLQSPNVGTPVAFTSTSTGFTIGGTDYTATKNVEGYYQLTNGSNFFAFEDKVEDPNYPGDENRCMYKGGGVTCKNTTNDTDRSYWLLVSEAEYEEWQKKKKVTVASLNVDGLPKSVKVAGVSIELNPDGKEGPGATAIAQRLLNSGFDIVGVSEDFNYHSELWDAAWNDGAGYNATTHRGSIGADVGAMIDFVQKKPVVESDGLCTFYKLTAVSGDGSSIKKSEKWTEWNEHYGYTDSGADGLIRKGYRFSVVTLADGTELDLYTLHMDAETNPEDNAARASQLTQLADSIKASKNGRPILIIGDTNCRYTRDNIKGLLIDAINADPRFTIRDPWIQFGRNNTYPALGTSSIMASSEGYLKGEVVDKIWYINNTESGIRFKAETYAQDLSFVDEEGSPLCDHKPCVVTFSYHDYDPVIDDVAVVETSEEAVFLRNRATGRYLMNGGWFGTHAVVGNYGKDMYIKSLPNGKYKLTSKYGDFSDDGYIDKPSGEGIQEFTIIEHEGYKIFSYDNNGTQKALTANDPTYFNDNPLYRYATMAALDVNDKHQQWEIVTKAQMNKEIAKATPTNPVNVTHLVKAANFDRNDWNEHGAWTFNRIGNKAQVTDNGIGGIDNDAFCNYNRSITTKKEWWESSNNQWNCYQELTGLPAGYYHVSCQGFESYSEKTNFYATSSIDGKSVALKADLSSLEAQTQTGAGRAFDKGEFVKTLEAVQVGADGKLTIGVRKTEDNGNDCWTVFDNFQLIYLGTEAPESSYYLYNVESGKLLNGGNAYNTQASIANDGQAWKPVYKSSGVQYTRDDGKGLYLSGNNSYVDGGTPGIWRTRIDDNGAMTIAAVNEPERFIGWNSEEKGTVVRADFQANEAELTDGIHWLAVKASDVETYKTNGQNAARIAALPVYRAAYLDSHIDTKEFGALWHNPNTTTSVITSAAATLKTKLEDEAYKHATGKNPYNYSHYISNATCGGSDFTGWTTEGGWSAQTTGLYNNNGVVLSPGFYEKWVDSSNALDNAKISQSLTSLPAGRYSVALDVNAQRQSDETLAITGILLYAKAGSKERVTTACDTHGSGVLPQTFITPVVDVAEGESLEIGLSIEGTNANWVAFDNWQLLYCGPYKDIKLNNEATSWEMTGVWREVDMPEVTEKLALTPKLLLDATNATLVGQPAIPTSEELPNMVIKVNKADDISNTANVLVGNTCENFVLTDKKDFAPEQTFTASKSYYTRTNTKGYNTVCMPFELYTNDFPGCKVYTYTGMTETTLRFTEMEEGASIAAGTPILVYSPTGDDWVLDLTGRAVVPEADGNETSSEKAGMNGSFLARTIGADYYKLNSAGTKFAKTTDAGKIVPFRFYLKANAQQQQAPAFSVSFVEGETTDIEEMLNDNADCIEETYDLNGRRILTITRPGIYVKGGKKIIKK
ncbi:MAG: hypothetical protein PUE86_10575 [Prevotella sp.]|nr:hypothetical protein [Prevotella sp.]